MRFALALMILGFFPIFLLMSLSVKAKPTISSPVIVELFTSQSCSSCPPADKLLGELSKNDNVIALSCHVTYWNHLHWNDTLSQAFCTDRQRSYVRAMKKRTSYTPQMVVNGRHDVVGSRAWQVHDVIEKAENEVLLIELSYGAGDLEINLPNIMSGRYQITLIEYGDNHTQSIPSGENRGRTVHYTNPVMDLIDLGAWDGSSKVINREINQDHSYAVLVHENHRHGAIIAAGKI